MSSVYSSDTSSQGSSDSIASTKTRTAMWFKNFMVEEINTYHRMRILITVHKSILENDETLTSVFSVRDKQLLFDDIDIISSLYKKYLVRTIQDMISGSCVSNSTVDFDDQLLLSEQLSEIIDTCELQAFNLGKLLNDYLFSQQDFKQSIWNLDKNMDYSQRMIKQKAQTNPRVSQWLQQCERLVFFKFSGNSIEELLCTPLLRLNQYPSTIKSLIVLRWSLDGYDLNISLIRVNRILSHNRSQPKLHLIDSNTSLNNNLEYSIDPEHEYGIENSKASHPKLHIHKPFDSRELAPLVKKFNRKFKCLTVLLMTFQKFKIKVAKFLQNQISIANYWNNTLQGDQFFDLIYHKYQQKLQVFSTLTENLINQTCEEIINPLQMCLDQAKAIGKIIRNFERACTSPGKNNDVFRLGNCLLSKLPLYFIFLDDFVQLVLNVYNQLIMKWLQLHIGKTKIEEYQQLMENDIFENHNDIVHFFLERKLDHI